jgi:hypothetical protein
MIQVTLDGRILIMQGTVMVELVSPEETDQVLTYLVEARALQAAIMQGEA